MWFSPSHVLVRPNHLLTWLLHACYCPHCKISMQYKCYPANSIKLRQLETGTSNKRNVSACWPRYLFPTRSPLQSQGLKDYHLYISTKLHLYILKALLLSSPHMTSLACWIHGASWIYLKLVWLLLCILLSFAIAREDHIMHKYFLFAITKRKQKVKQMSEGHSGRP